MSDAVAERPVVLVVEDDFLLRMDAVDIVRSAGFDAVEAHNADEAIAILEARPNIPSFPLMYRCRDQWMASSWLSSLKTDGRPSRS
jgi:CheY-like chemotaxis protein